LKTARSTAKIKKHITMHSLRHAYASHLLDAGTDIGIIQKLLGHSAHVTNSSLQHITSPLDTLGLAV